MAVGFTRVAFSSYEPKLLYCFLHCSESGFKIQWVDDTHALGIFSSLSAGGELWGSWARVLLPHTLLLCTSNLSICKACSVGALLCKMNWFLIGLGNYRGTCCMVSYALHGMVLSFQFLSGGVA